MLNLSELKAEVEVMAKRCAQAHFLLNEIRDPAQELTAIIRPEEADEVLLGVAKKSMFGDLLEDIILALLNETTDMQAMIEETLAKNETTARKGGAKHGE